MNNTKDFEKIIKIQDCQVLQDTGCAHYDFYRLYNSYLQKGLNNEMYEEIDIALAFFSLGIAYGKKIERAKKNKIQAESIFTVDIKRGNE